MTTPAAGIFWRARIIESFDIALACNLGLSAPAFAYPPHGEGAAALSLTPSLGMNGHGMSVAACDLSLTTMLPIVGVFAALDLALTPQIAVTGTERYARSADLSLTSSIEMTGHPNIIFVGATAVTGDSVTIPTHQTDDLILIFGQYCDTNQPPDKPTAGGTVPNWNYIDHNTGGDFIGSTTAWFKATASTTTSGTWAPCQTMIAVVLRNQHPTAPIGGHAESGSNSLHGATAPAITMTNTNGSSVLLEFFGRRATTSGSTWSAAPSGYTQRASVATTGFAHGVCLDTKDVTTSDGSVTQESDSSESKGYRGATVEILTS